MNKEILNQGHNETSVITDLQIYVSPSPCKSCKLFQNIKQSNYHVHVPPIINVWTNNGEPRLNCNGELDLISRT